MKSHDISEKLREIAKKLQSTLKSSDGKLLTTLTALLTELQMMANNPDPVRVARILSLILELGKDVNEKNQKREDE